MKDRSANFQSIRLIRFRICSIYGQGWSSIGAFLTRNFSIKTSSVLSPTWHSLEWVESFDSALAAQRNNQVKHTWRILDSLAANSRHLFYCRPPINFPFFAHSPKNSFINFKRNCARSLVCDLIKTRLSFVKGNDWLSWILLARICCRVGWLFDLSLAKLAKDSEDSGDKFLS